ncbi:MAG: amidohydrolase family protein [Gemmatimonadota bacterium]|nr:amidohydrolase family protein [Gemmatimonadota bacterium]
MRTRPTHRTVAALVGAALIAGCGGASERAADPDGDPTGATEGDRAAGRAFVGATLIDGSGGPPLEGAILLVGEDGRVDGVGPASAMTIPADMEQIDVSGLYIVPGLINTHGHVGDTRGLETGHYSRANVLDQLGVYARYGVTTVVSLGGDGAEGVAVRDEQDVPTLNRSRLYVAGPVVSGDTEDAVREMVDANAALGVDFIKIRVDDNLGATQKMSPSVYRAVIDRAHERELPVAAHLFYLEDAKGLLDAGVDFIVHSVRDVDVDDDLARRMIETGVCYSPTLAREVTTFVYGDVPGFFDDPFFLAEADPAAIAGLSDPEAMARVRESPSAAAYRVALAQAQENLGALSAAGVTIAMGTDTGPPGRFQGFYEHMELELMAESGMSAAEILVASTGDAADCVGREDIGVLEPGRWADFLVLEADPLADVRNLRAIRSVWIAGNEVPGR